MSSVKDERRIDLRLAGGGNIEAAVIDEASNPLSALQDAQVLNVSAGGLAIMTSTDVDAGSMIDITATNAPRWTPKSGRFRARVLRNDSANNGTHTLACELMQGHMPAALIYKW